MAAPVVAVVGATATGKTAFAEALATAIGGEIVCADSRQIFRELEIGTGKPTPAERAARPHHLFDAFGLEDRVNAGGYARAAAETCAEIRARGAVPILVGGSGLYLRALQSGLSVLPPHAPEIRERLRHELASVGSETLHARLRERDPDTAARLGPRDAQRITRALEVLEASGKPLSWWHRHPPAPVLAAEWRTLELEIASATLAERIAARTRSMFDGGLQEEVAALVERGQAGPLRRLRAVGYDEALDLCEGQLNRAQAEDRTNTRTRQLAKRQRTWFRHQMETTRLDTEANVPAKLLERAIEMIR